MFVLFAAVVCGVFACVMFSFFKKKKKGKKHTTNGVSEAAAV